MLALLGEEQVHHAVAVVAVARRAEEQVHRHALADAHDAGGRVVAGLAAVELVDLVDEDGGERLGGVAGHTDGLHEGGDVLALPAEVVAHADARVRAAVAHGDEQVVLLELDDGLEDLLAADVHLGPRVFEVLLVADEDDLRVVILDELGGLVVPQVDDGEGGIGDASDGAHRQCGGDGGDAFLDGQARGQHRGDDLGGERGEDARLYAAAQAVRQDDDGGAVALLHDVDVVAAQLLADMVDTLVSDIRTKIIHSRWTPSAWTGRSWFQRRFRPAGMRSPERCASACRRPCRRPRWSGG